MPTHASPLGFFIPPPPPSASDNWEKGGKQWDLAKKEYKNFKQLFNKTTAVVAAAESSAKNIEQSASKIVQVLSGVRGLLGLMGATSFFLKTLLIFFPFPASPDPAILASLNTIQVVTNETLARVIKVQSQLADIYNELEGFKSSFAQLECDLASYNLQTYVDDLSNDWLEYYGDPKSGIQPTPDSKAGKVFYNIQDQVAVFPNITLPASIVAEVDDWVADFLKNDKTYKAMNNINSAMLLDRGGVRPMLTQCAEKFKLNFTSKNPLPFDDRMYYEPILKIMSVRIVVRAGVARVRAGVARVRAAAWVAQRLPPPWKKKKN